MSDLISRKALVETIVNTPSEVSGYNPVYLTGCATRQNEILDMIERMPSFKQPKGEWISLEPEIGLFECSECGHKILRAECNFCPNCGADMRKKE